jgi:hypothetical protein
LAVIALRSTAASHQGWVAGLSAACWLALIWYYLGRFKPTGAVVAVTGLPALFPL